MKRRDLKKVAREVAEELEGKPYEFWTPAVFDDGFERDVDGQKVSVELTLLEDEEEYTHVGVAVSDYGLISSYWPVSTSIMVAKKRNTEQPSP